MTIVDTAKQALWKKSGLAPDHKGYVTDIERNLLPGVTREMIEEEYKGGSGHELNGKFRAVHSSAALAANTFGRWKTEPALLTFAGYTGFDKLALEAKCPTGLGGTPPNLDVLLKSTDTLIGIESKFLEPLKLTVPKFSTSYSRDRLPLCDDIWWDLLEQVRKSSASHLDAAQLIKHYLGLRKKSSDYKNVLLVYIFWKPLNADEFEEYTRHAEALETFQRKVQNSETIRFMSLDYLQLWDAWEKDRKMAEHARLLKDRYCVEI